MSEQKTAEITMACGEDQHWLCGRDWCKCPCHTKGSDVSPGDLSDLRAKIEQLRERNAKDKAAYDWRGGYDNALCDVLALLGAAQEKP